jgi:hypothetical protein
VSRDLSTDSKCQRASKDLEMRYQYTALEWGKAEAYIAASAANEELVSSLTPLAKGSWSF